MGSPPWEPTGHKANPAGGVDREGGAPRGAKGCNGGPMGVHGGPFGGAMGIPGGCMGVPWGAVGNPTGVQWGSFGVQWGIPWRCNRGSLGVQWGIPRDCNRHPIGDALPRAPVRPSDPNPTASGFGVSDGSPTHHGCHPVPAGLGPRWGEHPPEPRHSSLRRCGLRRVTKGDEQRMYLGWENQWGQREGRASSLGSFNSFGGAPNPVLGGPHTPPSC